MPVQRISRQTGVSFAWLLKTVICLSLISDCIAFDFTSQKPLTDQRPIPKLKWEVCGDTGNHTLECTRLNVPMDHFNSSSTKTFSIPLIRLLATNASSNNNQTIIFNPGGPGGSGIQFIKAGGTRLLTMLGETHHLLSFDPRGVASSIPRASCYPTSAQRSQAYLDVPFDSEYEAGKMFAKAENTARACVDTIGEHGAYVNTPQTAGDMNSILDAIGQEMMLYWGGSYGTTLGQTYAQMFPSRVSRLVIDGVSNLDEWYNAFVFEEYLIDTDAVFEGFITECFIAGPTLCPLLTLKKSGFKSAAELTDYVYTFLSDLEENPIPVYLNNTNYGSLTRQSLVTNGIFPSLYRPSAIWPTLATNLAALMKGNSSPAYLAYNNRWIPQVITDETFLFVTTNDAHLSGLRAPIHGLHPLQNFSLSLPQQSTLISKYRGLDVYNRASWSYPTTHDFHPHYYPKYPRVKTAEPILIISITTDLVCPLISAQKAHASFEGAGFLEQKSYGHCSLSMPSLCTAKHVRRYFNEGVLPEEGATCGIDAEYFPGEGKSGVSTLSEEDAELLEALEGLASQGPFNPMLPAMSLVV